MSWAKAKQIGTILLFIVWAFFGIIGMAHMADTVVVANAASDPEPINCPVKGEGINDVSVCEFPKMTCVDNGYNIFCLPNQFLIP